jgi:hypothetical protein
MLKFMLAEKRCQPVPVRMRDVTKCNDIYVYALHGQEKYYKLLTKKLHKCMNDVSPVLMGKNSLIT